MGNPTPPYDALKTVAEWCEKMDKCFNCPLNEHFGCYHPHEWPHIWENKTAARRKEIENGTKE